MKSLALVESAILLALALLGVAGRVLWARTATTHPSRGIAGDLITAWRSDPLGHRLALAGIVVAALLIRLLYLDQPMRLDEGWTYLAFASRSLRTVVTDHSSPNNHFFHTILVWSSTNAFGDSEWAIRLPALLSGVLIVVAVYVAARLLSDRDAALLAAALVSVLPSLILYSTNARGYSLLVLCFVALVCVTHLLLEADAPSRWLAFSAVMAAGMYTSPSMLYPAGVVTLWLVAETWRRGGLAAVRRLMPPLAWSLAVAALLTAAALAPAGIGSLASMLRGHRNVAPMPLDEFARALPPFARQVRASLALGLDLWMVGALSALALLSFAAGAHRRPRATLVLAAVAWCGLMLVATRHPPWPRVWLFLVPIGCVMASVALSELLRRVASASRLDSGATVNLGALAMVVAIGATVIAHRSVLETTETGGFKNGPEVARLLASELRPGDAIAVTAVNATSLDYYLRRFAHRPLESLRWPADSGRVFEVVNRQYDQTPDIVRQRLRYLPWTRLELARVHRFSDADVLVFHRVASPASSPRPVAARVE